MLILKIMKFVRNKIKTRYSSNNFLYNFSALLLQKKNVEIFNMVDFSYIFVTSQTTKILMK